MKELNDKIIEWLKKHNIDKLSPDKQYLKILEEVGELARGLLKNDLEAIKDAIGDIYVAFMGLALQLNRSILFTDDYYNRTESVETSLRFVVREVSGEITFTDIGLIFTRLSLLAKNTNLTLKECVDHAYNQIKDRDIKIIEGVAVK